MPKAIPLKKKKEKYWFKRCYGVCPVCGKNTSYRVKVLGSRPKYKGDREYKMTDFEAYCGCQGNFYFENMEEDDET